MEVISKYSGSIVEASEEAALLKFEKDGHNEFAVALRKLCYIGYEAVANPQKQLPLGAVIQFTAVLDCESWKPDIWKVVAAWTEMKPIKPYRVDDWDNIVSCNYKDQRLCLLTLESLVRKRITETGLFESPERNNDLEDEIVKHVLKKLELESNGDGGFSVFDECLYFQLFGDAGFEIWKYICDVYPTVTEFVGFHSRVFKVSREGIISISRPKDFDLAKDTLGSKTDHDSDSEDESFSDSSALKESDLGDEANAILCIANILKYAKDEKFLVYSPKSTKLESCLYDAPHSIRTYIKKYYNSLTRFIESHKTVFRFSKSNLIYVRGGNTIYNYIKQNLLDVSLNSCLGNLNDSIESKNRYSVMKCETNHLNEVETTVENSRHIKPVLEPSSNVTERNQSKALEDIATVHCEGNVAIIDRDNRNTSDSIASFSRHKIIDLSNFFLPAKLNFVTTENSVISDSIQNNQNPLELEGGAELCKFQTYVDSAGTKSLRDAWTQTISCGPILSMTHLVVE